MTKEQAKEYAQRYRKNTRITSIVVSIFIFIIAIILFTAATILIIYAEGDILIYVLAGIMIVLGIVDGFGGYKLIIFGRKKSQTISDKEALERYCRIHGFDSKITKEE